MIKHIVAWSHKDGFSDKQKLENALKIKHGLENLVGKIDGLIEAKVYINPLSTSHRDAFLVSLFETEEALIAYRIHPEHKKVSSFVHETMDTRVCLDSVE